MKISFFKNKKIVCFVAIIALNFLYKASQTYDDGYRAAWNGQGIGNFANTEQMRGYQQGLDDVWMYDEGYDDGKNNKRAKDPKNEDYMEGYQDAKKYR